MRRTVCICVCSIVMALLCFVFPQVRGAGPSLHRAGLCLQRVGSSVDAWGSAGSTAGPAYWHTNSWWLPVHCLHPLDRPQAAKREDFVLWALQEASDSSPRKFRPLTRLQWFFNLLQRWQVAALHWVRISGGNWSCLAALIVISVHFENLTLYLQWTYTSQF